MGNIADTETPALSVLVFGTQRSGTTLLCRMLTAHPDLFIQNELDVRRIFTQGADRKTLLQNIQQLAELEHGCALPDLLLTAGKRLWGLKDPELTYHTEELTAFLPQTRFIVIVRDARAVVASYINNRWGLGTNAYTGALRWRDEVEIQQRFCQLHSQNTLLLKFEDLIKDSSAELQRICEFLELTFHSDMLQYSNKPAFFEHGRENINTFKEPDKAMVDKWNHQLSAKQRSIIAYVCRSPMEQLGYAIEDEPYQPSRGEIAVYRLHQRIIGELQLQYRWRLSGIKRKLRQFRQRAKDTETVL